MSQFIEDRGEESAIFVISVAARMLKVHPQTLRYYERAGLLAPSRSKGNVRYYSMGDVRRAMQIRGLMEDLGVNLAGAEVIMKLLDRIHALEAQIEEMRRNFEAEIARVSRPSTKR